MTRNDEMNYLKFNHILRDCFRSGFELQVLNLLLDLPIDWIITYER